MKLLQFFVCYKLGKGRVWRIMKKIASVKDISALYELFESHKLKKLSKQSCRYISNNLHAETKVRLDILAKQILEIVDLGARESKYIGIILFLARINAIKQSYEASAGIP